MVLRPVRLLFRLRRSHISAGLGVSTPGWPYRSRRALTADLSGKPHQNILGEIVSINLRLPAIERLLGKRLSDIDEMVLERLVDRVEEGHQLDFKEVVGQFLSSGEQCDDFAKDVCAFANAKGWSADLRHQRRRGTRQRVGAVPTSWWRTPNEAGKYSVLQVPTFSTL